MEMMVITQVDGEVGIGKIIDLAHLPQLLK